MTNYKELKQILLLDHMTGDLLLVIAPKDEERLF